MTPKRKSSRKTKKKSIKAKKKSDEKADVPKSETYKKKKERKKGKAKRTKKGTKSKKSPKKIVKKGKLEKKTKQTQIEQEIIEKNDGKSIEIINSVEEESKITVKELKPEIKRRNQLEQMILNGDTEKIHQWQEKALKNIGLLKQKLEIIEEETEQWKEIAHNLAQTFAERSGMTLEQVLKEFSAPGYSED
ncbi:MAG: hypothetical protein ACXAC7_07145 [Candidatus Hodarchaeales archaeon]|jgi:hypothetical protein